MIFQEPMNSFSPVHTVGIKSVEALRIHTDVSQEEARKPGIEMLAKRGYLSPSEDRHDPHELSGGCAEER
jgi:ABC-type microcin C transport system duplicated ATPase subunit YejF